MGTIYSVSCPDCGHISSYYSGPGMMDYDDRYRIMKEYERELKLLKPECDGKIKRTRKTKSVFERIQSGYHGQEIKEILETHPISEWDTDKILGSKTPYYCKKCEKIRLRYKKEIFWQRRNRRQSFDVPELCSVCKTEMTLPGAQIEPIKCPRCGSHNAHIEPTGIWD